MQCGSGQLQREEEGGREERDQEVVQPSRGYQSAPGTKDYAPLGQMSTGMFYFSIVPYRLLLVKGLIGCKVPWQHVFLFTAFVESYYDTVHVSPCAPP